MDHRLNPVPLLAIRRSDAEGTSRAKGLAKLLVKLCLQESLAKC